MTLIKPSKGWVPLNFSEILKFRELLGFLIWRDLKVRYRQTVLGVLWAVIQPFVTMVVFTVFFGRLGKIPSDEMPYSVFTYAALLPWNYFSQSVTQASNSLTGNANLITKVYFPRLIVPISAAVTGLVDFAIAFIILLILMAYYGVVPTMTILTLPFFVLLAVTASLGISFWFSALNVEFRDVRYVVPFLIQFGLIATPVAYSSSLVPHAWRVIYGLNPMVGVIEGFRWALFGKTPLGGAVVVSAISAVFLFVSGLFYFRRVERSFADVI